MTDDVLFGAIDMEVAARLRENDVDDPLDCVATCEFEHPIMKHPAKRSAVSGVRCFKDKFFPCIVSLN